MILSQVKVLIVYFIVYSEIVATEHFFGTRTTVLKKGSRSSLLSVHFYLEKKYTYSLWVAFLNFLMVFLKDYAPKLLLFLNEQKGLKITSSLYTNYIISLIFEDFEKN